ncbi:MAG TPA: M90 family metallopeptidase [Gemmatimonadaceae bacterium]|nr:M90 family metallopeptidase [Gemmatimonadaceae bacterium]
MAESVATIAIVLAVSIVLLIAVARGANRFAAEQQQPRAARASAGAELLRDSLLRIFVLLPDPVRFFRRRRRARVRAAPFPAAWRAILSNTVPLYARLPAPTQRALEGHVQVLLAEKQFEGCGGLELTDEVRVTIAGHAALLLLGEPEPRYYPRLISILVYPAAYRAPDVEHHGGVVTERADDRLGESWQDGVVVLAWDAARAGARDAHDGENVILHEFAHQLDSEDGAADGVPYLERPSDYRAWARALAPEYERLRANPQQSVLNAYGRPIRQSSSPWRRRPSSRTRSSCASTMRRCTGSCAGSMASTRRHSSRPHRSGTGGPRTPRSDETCCPMLARRSMPACNCVSRSAPMGIR